MLNKALAIGGSALDSLRSARFSGWLLAKDSPLMVEKREPRNVGGWLLERLILEVRASSPQINMWHEDHSLPSYACSGNQLFDLCFFLLGRPWPHSLR